MENNELNQVIRQLRDVKLMIKIRDAGLSGAAAITNSLSDQTINRLSHFYWACDIVDLLALETQLIHRYTELVDISSLITQTQRS